MDPIILVNIIVLIVLFFLSGLFSASETALMGLGRLRLAKAIERKDTRAKALEIWQKNPNNLLTTILILNNTVNITATTVAAFLSVHLAELLDFNRAQMGTLLAAMVTLVVLLFGEITPKILAIHKSEKIALLIIRPLVLCEKILKPLIKLLVGLANIFTRPFGLKPGSTVPVITEEEIHAVIEMGADEGIIEDQEHQMIHGVIKLSETQVREVMIHRTEMECINAAENIDNIIEQIVQTGYSRMPVYRDNVDNIIGIIYAKDVISVLQNRELIVLQDILRHPYFVPETKKVDELLHEFQRGKIHLAVVVDEYGGTSGLVTLEDLMEEIVGEIRDEYDDEEKLIEKSGENIWLVNGQTDIKEVNNTLESNLPDVKDLNTIGGFIIDLLGHLPKKGEKIIYENWEFIVILASSRKVDKIKIRKLRQMQSSNTHSG